MDETRSLIMKPGVKGRYNDRNCSAGSDAVTDRWCVEFASWDGEHLGNLSILTAATFRSGGLPLPSRGRVRIQPLPSTKITLFVVMATTL